MFVSRGFSTVMLAAAGLGVALLTGLTPLAAAMGRILPMGGVLAFSTPTDPRSEWTIMLLDVRTRLLYAAGSYNWRIPLPLQWSPDGTRLAFATVSTPSDIYIRDIYAGKTTNLTRSYAEDRYPTWSPDGSRLLFFSNVGGPFEIYSIAPDGTDLTRLTSDEGILPTFSPDGGHILFTATAWRHLHLMNADGSGVRPVTQGPRYDENAVWSPDGQQIAFIGRVSDGAQVGMFIFMMSSACLDDPTCEPTMPFPDFRFQGMPQWSPDSRYLAFVGQTRRDRLDAIYVMDREQGGEPRQLVSDVMYAYVERWPMWSPDSRTIAFARRNQPGLFLVEVATGKIDQLLDIRTVYPVWKP
ncbi:MAG: hypothetical protein K8J31_13390 [Anaerolineae bacterium]|nr:hypothetical protein [Anaerolineae bacterium]